MDDLKFYAKNEKCFESHVQTVQILSDDLTFSECAEEGEITKFDRI